MRRPDGAGGEFGGGGGQLGRQHLAGQRSAWREQGGLLYSSLGFSFRQIQHRRQQTRGGTESGGGTHPFRIQLRDHRKNVRIGPPQIGLSLPQPVQQPVNAGVAALLHQRGHATIVATSTDNLSA